ncbi:MAG: biopolymer transporter ExbD [Desulfuromonas sp.]|nr:MAG: biopolymer transporter ExbD [Desulfuromonas sp.]
MSFHRNKREDVRVELTPMIDVVFLLLIFFMISTTFIETPGISIKLPESSTSIADKEPEEIKVYLAENGNIYLRDEQISLAALQAHLKTYGARSAQMTFLLMADKEAKHGQVVQLMDSAKSNGFGKLAIATEQKRK